MRTIASTLLSARAAASSGIGKANRLRKVAWNNRCWLLSMGLLAGLGVGYFQFVKATPKFRSTAQIQIVEPNVSNLPIAGIEATSANQKAEHHRRSTGDAQRADLRRAAEIG